ncbi:wall-associated receptor kinase carboxy-terminal protein, partial [Trifolium medium]|nr:wall-associated receptor kinase carboxy-terminal protein [Trifolium medium]
HDNSLKTSFTNQSNTLELGFELRWSGVDDERICHDCNKFGGRCGYNTSTNEVMCLSSKKSATPSPQVA